MLKIVQRNKDSRLDLAGGSRLTSRQKLHTCQACQKLKRHASWSTTGQNVQTSRSVISRLELAAQSSRESKPPASYILKNLTLPIPFSPQYKYPLYPRNTESFQKETLEKNKIDSSIIFTQRLFKFLYSHPFYCYILEKFITKTFFTIPTSVRRSFGAWKQLGMDQFLTHPQSSHRDSSNSSTLILSIVTSLRGSIPKPFLTIPTSVRRPFGIWKVVRKGPISYWLMLWAIAESGKLKKKQVWRNLVGVVA